MPSENPVHWTEPSTWPWIVYVWLVMLAAGWAKPLWRWVQRNRAAGWPFVNGQIESASVSEVKSSFFSSSRMGSSPTHIAELRYSYPVGGSAEAGVCKREFDTEREASEFVRDLKGKSVVVHYNPNKPSSSLLSDDSINAVLATRAPQAMSDDFPSRLSDAVPEWLDPFLWLFVGLSVVGFVLSLWVHLGAVAGRRLAPAPFFWILHLGIFVVWFPAVIVANRLVGNVNRKDSWKVILNGSPNWVRYLIYGFLGYAVINLMYVFYETKDGHDTGDNPPAVAWRGFSGHWMVFYLAALTILYTAAKRRTGSNRCVLGHRVGIGANFCPRCGQAAIRQ
jgi:hypothetical protein